VWYQESICPLRVKLCEGVMWRDHLDMDKKTVTPYNKIMHATMDKMMLQSPRSVDFRSDKNTAIGVERERTPI
jgi:hypothetical protein